MMQMPPVSKNLSQNGYRKEDDEMTMPMMPMTMPMMWCYYHDDNYYGTDTDDYVDDDEDLSYTHISVENTMTSDDFRWSKDF